MTNPTPTTTPRYRILIVTPMALGLCRAEYCSSLVNTSFHLANAGHQTIFSLNESGSVVQARNTAAAQVLNDPSITHLLFLDADMSWQPGDAVVDMISRDKECIMGVYSTKWINPKLTMRVGDIYDAVEKMDGDLLPLTHAPTGFMLLRRDALERTVAYTKAGGHGAPKVNFASAKPPEEPGAYLIFDARVSEEDHLGVRHYVSDDFGFSETYRRAGGTLWAYPHVTIRHYYTGYNEACLWDWYRAVGLPPFGPLRVGEVSTPLPESPHFDASGPGIGAIPGPPRG